MTELKPCPCCGPKAFIVPATQCDPPIGEHCWTAKLRCHECGLNISRTAATEKEALDQVIEAWNTRAERTCHPVRWSGKSFSEEEKKTTLDARCSECRGFLGEAWEVFECECDLFCSGCGAKVVE
jgi:hypothetical protein